MKWYKLFVLSTALLASLGFSQVNINTASATQLSALPNIGEVKAKAIVKYRKQNGRFKSVKELANVKGIGEKTVRKIGRNAKISGKTDLSKLAKTTKSKAIKSKTKKSATTAKKKASSKTKAKATEKKKTKTSKQKSSKKSKTKK